MGLSMNIWGKMATAVLHPLADDGNARWSAWPLG